MPHKKLRKICCWPFCYTVVNLAVGGTALQYTYTTGTQASLASDGNPTTRSCTSVSQQPWWAVGLATAVIVTGVEITSDYHDNYRKYWLRVGAIM